MLFVNFNMADKVVMHDHQVISVIGYHYLCSEQMRNSQNTENKTLRILFRGLIIQA